MGTKTSTTYSEPARNSVVYGDPDETPIKHDKKAGVAGKCSETHQVYVRAVETELDQIAGFHINFDDCAELKTDGVSILATTNYPKGIQTERLVALGSKDFVELYQLNTRHQQITGMMRDMVLFPDAPSALDEQKFERAKQLILGRSELSPEIKQLAIPSVPVFPMGPSLPARPYLPTSDQ